MHRGGVQRELGGRLGRKIGELEFLDGPVAVEREADRVAGAGTFGERCIEHPRPAELLEQIFRDLEGAAIRADVLSEQERFGPLREDLAETEIECLGGVELNRGGRFGPPGDRRRGGA